MNTNISLVFSNLKDIEGNTLNVSIDENIMLDPFYASIHDIELYFHEDVEFTEKFIGKLNEIIFNKSIYIDNYTKNKFSMLTKEDAYIIKREYVICAAAYEASKHIYINSLKSSTVRKQLGDFIVERQTGFDLSAVNRISDDAKNCMDAIIDEIDAMTNLLAAGFVLGEWNGRNHGHTDRLWHRPNYESRVPIAADKFKEENGRYYKTGVAHAHR